MTVACPASSSYILFEHAPSLCRAVIRTSGGAQAALSLAMRACSPVFSTTGSRVDHGSWARRSQTACLVIVSKRVGGRSSVNFFIVSVIELPLPGLASTSGLWNSSNTDLAVASSAIRTRVGILQAQLLLFVVSSVVCFVSYTSIPSFIGV